MKDIILTGNQPATTSDTSTRFIKITNSSHPFHGQIFELLSVTDELDRSVIIQLPTGSRSVIPIGWTDYRELGDSFPLTEGNHLLDLGGLCEVIDTMNAIKTKGQSPSKSLKEA